MKQPLLLTILLLAILVNPLWAVNENAAVKQFRFAKGLFDRGMLTEAVEEARKFVDFYRDSKHYSKGLFLLAETQYRLNKYKEATESFEEFIRLFPESELLTDARYSLAWSLFSRKEYKEALEVFNLLHGVNDREMAVDAKYRSALILMQQKKYTTAEKLLEELLKVSPPTSISADACFSLFQVEIAQKKKNEAERTLKTLIRQFPSYKGVPDACFNLGELAYGSGKLEEAIHHYQKGLRLSSTSDDQNRFRQVLAYTLLENQKFKDAAKEFTYLLKVEKEKKNREKLLLGLGKCLFFQGKYSESVKKLEEITGSGREEALFYLGYSAFKLKKYDDALNLFSRVDGAGYFGGESQFFSGVAEFQQQKYSQAIKSFEKYLARKDGSRHQMAMFNMAQSYYNLKKYQEAETHLRKLLAEAKEKSLIDQVNMELAENLIAMKKTKEAQNAFLAIPTTSSFFADARLRLGEFAETEGNMAQAIEYYQAVPEGQKISALARLRTGKLFLQQGKTKEAMAVLQKIPVDSTSQSRESRYLQATLLIERGEYQQGDQILSVLSEKGRSWRYESLLLLATSAGKQNKLSEQKLLLERLLTETKQTNVLFEATQQYAEFYLKQSLWKEAILQLEQSQKYAASNSEQAQLLLTMGDALLAQKEVDKATRAWLKIDILYADTTEHHAALLRLVALYQQNGEEGKIKNLLTPHANKGTAAEQKALKEILESL